MVNGKGLFCGIFVIKCYVLVSCVDDCKVLFRKCLYSNLES